MNRGSRCIKIKQLRVHTRPVLELCGHCMLMKGPVIGQPNMAAKIQMCTEDEKLILQKVPPVVRKVRHQNGGEDRELFGPIAMSSICQCNFLGCDVNTRQLWNRNCGPGSLACRFVGSRSHRSTYLTATI